MKIMVPDVSHQRLRVGVGTVSLCSTTPSQARRHAHQTSSWVGPASNRGAGLPMSSRRTDASSECREGYLSIDYVLNTIFLTFQVVRHKRLGRLRTCSQISYNPSLSVLFLKLTHDGTTSLPHPIRPSVRHIVVSRLTVLQSAIPERESEVLVLTCAGPVVVFARWEDGGGFALT